MSIEPVEPIKTAELVEVGRPFGITDLMIVTATVAFVLMIQDSSPNFVKGDHWLRYVMQFSHASLTGVFLAALIWIPRHRMRTGKFVQHPGHWILAAQMVAAVGILGFWITSWFEMDDIPSPTSFPYAISLLVSAGLNLFAAGVSIAAIFSCKGRWKVTMALIAVYCLLLAVTYVVSSVVSNQLFGFSDGWLFSWFTFYQWGFPVIAASVAISICVAATIDLVTKTKRDWLHRVGVLALLASVTVLPVIQFFYIRILNAELLNQ